jgi:hypothetical protein
VVRERPGLQSVMRVMLAPATRDILERLQVPNLDVYLLLFHFGCSFLVVFTHTEVMRKVRLEGYAKDAEAR